MEEKVKISLPMQSIIEVELNGIKVKVNDMITLEQYETILEDIKETILYNKSVSDKCALMHIRYIKDILDLCTNIDVENLTGEDLNSCALRDFLIENIKNFLDMEKYMEKEYDQFVMENCLGVLANKLPSSEDMERSMAKLSETIESLPEDKLNTIAKTIVWDKMPALGNTIAPATHTSNSIEG